MIRSLAIVSGWLVLSVPVRAQVTALPPVDLTPERGGWLDWTYVQDQEVLVFPVLRSAMLNLPENTLDEARQSILNVLQHSFPDIRFSLTVDFPTRKNGEPESRSRIKFPEYASFAADVCRERNVRSALLARVSYQTAADGVTGLIESEMLLVDAEAYSAVAAAEGWAGLEAGIGVALAKAAEHLTEQRLYVVRPKIAVTVLKDDRGRRTGASIPVGSRVGILNASELLVLGRNEDGVESTIARLIVEKESTALSLCQLKDIRDRDEIPADAICIPCDADARKDIKMKKPSAPKTGR